MYLSPGKTVLIGTGTTVIDKKDGAGPCRPESDRRSEIFPSQTDLGAAPRFGSTRPGSVLCANDAVRHCVYSPSARHLLRPPLPQDSDAPEQRKSRRADVAAHPAVDAGVQARIVGQVHVV